MLEENWTAVNFLLINNRKFKIKFISNYPLLRNNVSNFNTYINLKFAVLRKLYKKD